MRKDKKEYMNFICDTDRGYISAMNNIIRINEARPGFYKCRNCVLVDTVNKNIDCPLIRKNVVRGVI